jgi:hypothetical protein
VLWFVHSGDKLAVTDIYLLLQHFNEQTAQHAWNEYKMAAPSNIVNGCTGAESKDVAIHSERHAEDVNCIAFLLQQSGTVYIFNVIQYHCSDLNVSSYKDVDFLFS